MEYHNKLPPEGINTTRVHPLKQFMQLAIGALVLVVIVVVFLQFTGAFLAKRIPFTYETAVVERLDSPFGDASDHPEMTAYLNDLAMRLSDNMPMPDDMAVTVHYDAEDVFNAFATVGGNLLFYKGLLAKIPDENTLAMVMAHEISHVLHRDPIAAMGGGVASTLALLGLTGNAGTGMAGSVLNKAGLLTGVQFTRKMEVAADRQALNAMQASYGHVGGAAELFAIFQAQRGSSSSSQPAWLERFMSTHPLDQDRIDQIEEMSVAENWSLEGPMTPLPEDFKVWLLTP